MNKSHVLIFLLIAACFFVFMASIFNMLYILNELGANSVFAKISLSDEAKMYVSLHLTFSFLSFGLLTFGVFYCWKGLMYRAGFLALFGGIFEVFSLVSAYVFGFSLSLFGISVGALGMTFSFTTALIVFSAFSSQISREPFMLPYQIAVSSVLSALTAVITIITGSLVPSPTGGYTHIGDMIIFVAALLFGSKVGGITGIVGSVVADFWLAYPRWYVSIPAHGLEGAIAGFGKNKSVAIQVLLCAFAGFVMASTYFYVNIFIKGYPLAIISYARDLFGQVGISLILAMATTKSVEKARLLWR